MFGLFKKNPLKELEKQYKKTLTMAMNAQRSGNIQEYARLTEEAEGILKRIDALKES